MAGSARSREEKEALLRFGETLVALRDEAELSQSKLAARAGLDPSQISDMERGISEPRLETLVRLAGGLGQSIEQLFKGLDWPIAQARRRRRREPAGRLLVTPPEEAGGRP